MMQIFVTLLITSIALVEASSSAITALPLPPLNVNIALDVARKFSPLIFWPVSAIIFNLAKGGKAYPIGPLAQEEGATLVPSTFNKIRWFVTGQLFAVSILVAGVTSVIGLPFKEVPQLQRFANFVVLPLGLVAGVGHSIWVNKRFKGAQIGRVSNVGSCTVAQTFWLLLFSTDFLFRVKEGVTAGVFAKASQAVLAANFLTFANYMVISIIGLRLVFLGANKFDSKAFEKNFMGVAEEF